MEDEKFEKIVRFLIGIIALMFYTILYTPYGTYYFFMHRLLATLSSTFFIYPIIKMLLFEIDDKTFISSMVYGVIFFGIYVWFSQLTTYDTVRIFLEQFIAVCFILYLASHIREGLLKNKI